jgi:integrase
MSAGIGIFGPYRHGDRWRVLTRAVAGGEASYNSFASKATADEFVDVARGELDRSVRTVGEAIDSYRDYLKEKGNGEASLTETPRRLRQFYAPHLDDALEVLTGPTCRLLHKRLRETRRTKSGADGVRVETDQPLSVDTCRNTLLEARSFAKWCVGKKWLKVNPLDGVEGLGKRTHGKPQLRIDEARAWTAKALTLAKGGDVGAVGALLSLTLGLRASEITERVARDLDDDGRLLWIPESKTNAGRRNVEVPPMVRPFLKRLARRKAPADLLFGKHWRDWVRANVTRICKLAEVPEVCAHSMRGLHATIAVEAGATGHLVATALGHEDFRTTTTSYAKPEAQRSAKRRAALKVLTGGVASRPARSRASRRRAETRRS